MLRTSGAMAEANSRIQVFKDLLYCSFYSKYKYVLLFLQHLNPACRVARAFPHLVSAFIYISAHLYIFESVSPNNVPLFKPVIAIAILASFHIAVYEQNIRNFFF